MLRQTLILFDVYIENKSNYNGKAIKKLNEFPEVEGYDLYVTAFETH